MNHQLARIEVRTGWALRHINFVYSDGQQWSLGISYGPIDPKVVKFAKGEFLVRVTHESFIHHWSMGAFLELETNFGRVYTYRSNLTSRDASKMTTFQAKPNHEIICLKVTRLSITLFYCAYLIHF